MGSDVQGKLFPVEHIGTYPERRKTRTEEEVFAKKWEETNKVEPWRNFGQCLLEMLLSKPGEPWGDLTQRDATVAASVIQWLGTNCGAAFIHECEHEIYRLKNRQRKKERRKFKKEYNKWRCEAVAKVLSESA